MNRIKVKLPFPDKEIEQFSSGHPVTEAAEFLQKTIILQTPSSPLPGLELGSGNGIISIMLSLQNPQWLLTGIELQKELFDLSESNAIRTGTACEFINGDIREYKSLLKHAGYELIYSNPPWIKAGGGLISPDEVRAISRQEIQCTMKDILACIDWCLHPDGTAWVIYPVERKNELAREVRFTALEVANIIQTDEYNGLFIAKLRVKNDEKQWF